jgi:NitT/TauT family transport system substrate-binding protein
LSLRIIYLFAVEKCNFSKVDVKMEKLKKRKALSATLIIIVIVALFGYWYWTYMREKPSPYNLRYGHMGIADNAPIFVAVEKGFFAEEGLNITLVQFTGGPQIIEAVVGGSIDVGHTGIVPALMAYSQGINIRIMTDQAHWDLEHDASAWVVKNDSDIASVDDLKGKKYTVNSYGTLTYFVASTVFQRHGLTVPNATNPSGDIEVSLIPFPKMPQALLAGQVDVIDTVEPYVTIAVQLGGKVMYHPATSIFSDHVWHTATAFFTQDFVEKNKGVVDAFIRANVKAVDWIKDNREGTMEIIAKYTGLDYDLVKAMALPAWSESLDAGGVQREMELLLEEGWITEPLNITQLVYSP